MLVVDYVYRINPEWSEYDQSVARAQLMNYDVIFLDVYGLPVDDEYELEELYKKYAE